jgi:thiosulfate/3-mercaptopyruvate sulfurtransferase
VRDLISTEWLANHLSDPDICILDCSWHLPAAKRNARTEFEVAHIPGAQFFDLDAISDTESKLPHMLPSDEKFGREVAKLGAGNNKRIICYDSVGLFSAARAWWMFKAFGHVNVAVLDGGLKKWLAEERETESGLKPIKWIGSFWARLDPSKVIGIDDVVQTKAQIIDARSPARFRGEEAEARAGVKPGYIPGAKNVHYSSLLHGNGTLRHPNDLLSVFKKAKVNLEKPIITSCGSGVTAAILTLALTELGAGDLKLYDGSWAEWGASGREIATGG